MYAEYLQLIQQTDISIGIIRDFWLAEHDLKKRGVLMERINQLLDIRITQMRARDAIAKAA